MTTNRRWILPSASLLFVMMGCNCTRPGPAPDATASGAIQHPASIMSSPNTDSAPVAPTGPRSSVVEGDSEAKAIESQALLARLRALRAKVDYRGPGDLELQGYRRAVLGLLDVEPAVPPSGFQSVIYPDLPSLRFLVELRSARRGAGALVVRPASAMPLVVEAPHTFFDEGTLDLAVEVFAQLGARALLISTTPRVGGPNQGASSEADERAAVARSGEAVADVAHLAESFFLGAHAELCSVNPPLLTLQLHGFRDDLLPGVSAVLSAAGTQVDPHPLADALGQVLGRDALRISPDEVRQLEGRSNRQAEVSRQQNRAFLHLELSRSLRQRINADAALRRSVINAFRSALFQAQ